MFICKRHSLDDLRDLCERNNRRRFLYSLFRILLHVCVLRRFDVQNRFISSYDVHLRFFVAFTSHWKFQVECLSSQLTHDRWSIAIRQSFVECFWAHCSHFFEFLHVLLTWSYRWHLKYCFIRHSFSKYSQTKCVCSFNNFLFIKRFVIFELTISIIKEKNFLRWLMIFFIHVTRNMSKYLCNVLFCLTIFSIVVF